MLKKIFWGLLSLSIIATAFFEYDVLMAQKSGERSSLELAQADSSKEHPLGAYVNYETTIEDFENTNYGTKDIHYIRKSDAEWAAIEIRDMFPAPIPNSKKYLGVKLVGKKGNALEIKPPKKLIIDKYCQSISAWVYGKKLAGELSILLQDAAGTTHRLVLGVLDFAGWRKLNVRLTKKVAQQDAYLTQKSQMEILKIMYKPHTQKRELQEHRLYIDDITAMVREKYLDRQSDDW